jgi:ankyrin repeat protein
MKAGGTRKKVPDRSTFFALLMMMVVVGYWWVSYRDVAAIMGKKQRDEAFFHAIEKNDATTVAVMLDREMGPNFIHTETENYLPPLPYALHVRADAVVRLLLERGADPNYKGKENYYEPNLALALQNAAWTEQADNIYRNVQALLAKGVRVNDTNANGCSPLMLAVWAGRGDLMKLLLNHGADPNLIANQYFSTTQHGAVTALSLAVEKRNARIVRLLLAQGANPKHKNSQGQTLLQAAQGDRAIIALLKEAVRKKP